MEQLNLTLKGDNSNTLKGDVSGKHFIVKISDEGEIEMSKEEML